MRFSRTGGTAVTTGVAVVTALLTGGCANAPSLSVLGAYFPAWLFCIVASVVLAVMLYVVLARTRNTQWLSPPGVVYPTLVTFLALVVWLIFFQR
ncbi:YtcA family lipoprotein [Trinickia sp. YCB016]